MAHFEFPVIVIMLALIQYLYFTFRTGISRPKYNVPAPKTVGNDTWERLFRIQQNTAEQLVAFIPSNLAFAYFVSQTWAGILGLVFILARQIYSMTYMKEPKTRMFPPTFFVNVGQIIGVIIGAAIALSKTM